jgi:adenine-specific DNA-methyltransferase
MIFFQKTSYATAEGLPAVGDYLVWYAKEKSKVKFRKLFVEGGQSFDDLRNTYVELSDGAARHITADEALGKRALAEDARLFFSRDLASAGPGASTFTFEFRGTKYHPGANRHWKFPLEGMKRLAAANRLFEATNSLRYKRYLNDFPFSELTNVWTDTIVGSFHEARRFVVQTSPKVVQRCVLMTTDPGDLVLDPTCGSGTTAYVCEQWGRRWITCDTSRVATTIAKQRLMTAAYDYYDLAHPQEGVGSGFRYRTVEHIVAGTVANALAPSSETLYDRPIIEPARGRVSGPFTLEAVPAPTVSPVEELPTAPAEDAAVARTGTTLRQAEWRAHLARAGIRGRAGERIEFASVEPQGGTRYLNAIGKTKGERPQLVGFSFGPEHAPLEQRQVELAWEEARGLSPRPDILAFAAFQFDPEAAKDIDELDPAKTSMTFLRVQMDSDLLVDDLRKKSGGDHSFWLIGQPDVQLQRADGGKFKVEVAGFDYYDPRSGAIESGDTSKIAMWLLDTDYDGRSLLPTQVFFPMAGEKDGWSKLGKDLKAVVDENLLETYRGTISLPFEAGAHKRVAVKIVDDRGIESLKLLELE